jgi:dienelactone hydrolase
MSPRILILALAIGTLTFTQPLVGSAEVPKIRSEYFNPPKSWPADVCQEMARAADTHAIFYSGPVYQGKATRVFAFYGIPANASATNKVPGIVLVHGGGGTAFETWVKQWVDRGYAAISMDTCGAVPIGTDPKRGRFSNAWQRLSDGGPAGWGGFDDVTDAAEDNWMHQATATVILANSFLRSLPEVDPDRIGLTGISWGGVLTCRAAGLDDRFKFAVPVYGCGFLHENSTWINGLKQMGERGVAWSERYDPSRVLPNARMPILWLNGTNDFAFPPDSWRKSARTAPGTAALCMPLRMPHGHGGAGENPVEIAAFADAVVQKGEPMLRLSAPKVTDGTATVTWQGSMRPRKAELIFTRVDTGPWKDRLWETQPAEIDAAGTAASASLPPDAKYWYFHVTDHRDVAVSTEYVEVTKP